MRAVQRVSMLPSRVGYLDVSVFSDSTADEVAAGVDSLTRMGMQSLVLDLRGNPGGLVEQGAAVTRPVSRSGAGDRDTARPHPGVESHLH